jgi:hypothetical protein
MPAVSRPAAPAARSAAKSPAKAGAARDIDLALHLPLRYEDETRITPLANARDGETVQIEATVTASEVQLRPRRQLLVQVDDATGSCELRFFSFYPSHQKTMAVGARLRIRGEVKGASGGGRCCTRRSAWRAGELPAGADARLPHHRRAAPALPAPRRGGPWAGGPVGHPAARLRSRLGAFIGPKWPAALMGICARRSLFCTTPRPMWPWPRWKTTATPPGSA